LFLRILCCEKGVCVTRLILRSCATSSFTGAANNNRSKIEVRDEEGDLLASRWSY